MRSMSLRLLALGSVFNQEASVCIEISDFDRNSLNRVEILGEAKDLCALFIAAKGTSTLETKFEEDLYKRELLP